MVHQTFTDKLICIKDSHYLKQIHRDSQTEAFQLGQATCFSEPPKTLEAKVTLQILRQHVPSLFLFMSWPTMMKENQQHPHYLGFVGKVFEDMQKHCKLISVENQRSFVQVQLKLFDMKFFLDSAILHVRSAIRRQASDISS